MLKMNNTTVSPGSKCDLLLKKFADNVIENPSEGALRLMTVKTPHLFDIKRNGFYYLALHKIRVQIVPSVIEKFYGK